LSERNKLDTPRFVTCRVGNEPCHVVFDHQRCWSWREAGLWEKIAKKLSFFSRVFLHGCFKIEIFLVHL